MTPKQVKLMLFLQKRGKYEVPSFQEIANHVPFASRGNVAKALNSLEREGFVTREYNKPYSVKVLKKI